MSENENGNEEVPEELEDEKGYLKIAVAGGISATVIGGTIVVLGGFVPADNPAAIQIVTLFVAFAGAVGGFLFKKFSK